MLFLWSLWNLEWTRLLPLLCWHLLNLGSVYDVLIAALTRSSDSLLGEQPRSCTRATAAAVLAQCQTGSCTRVHNLRNAATKSADRVRSDTTRAVTEYCAADGSLMRGSKLRRCFLFCSWFWRDRNNSHALYCCIERRYDHVIDSLSLVVTCDRPICNDVHSSDLWSVDCRPSNSIIDAWLCGVLMCHCVRVMNRMTWQRCVYDTCATRDSWQLLRARGSFMT